MHGCRKHVQRLFSLVAIFFQFFQTAIAQNDTHNGVELSLIYPESVIAGEQFHIYASVYNGSDHALIYPTITHPSWTEEGYTYRTCIKTCQGQIDIQPGETRVMPAGVFYNSADTLQPTELLVDDLKFISLINGSLTLAESAFDSVTIDITMVELGASTPSPNPRLYPIPARQALQKTDHVIHDPNTGYHWISPDQTRYLTATQLGAAIAAGGQYAGYSVARASDVEQLILNHIHAAGLPAQINDLRPRPPAHLHDAINELFDLIFAAAADDNRFFPAGIVADRGLSYNTAPGIASLMIFTGVTSTGCNCATGGLSWRATALTSVDGVELQQGAWLVRRPAALPEIPSTRPSLFDGELVLPDVYVEGVHYQAALRLTDQTNLVFFLTEMTMLQEQVSGLNTLVFGGNPASVTIPELEVINNDGSRSTLSAILELVPDTIPPAFVGRVLPES